LHPNYVYSTGANVIALVFLDKQVTGVPLMKMKWNASVPVSPNPPSLTAIGLGLIILEYYSNEDVHNVYPTHLKRMSIKPGSVPKCKKWYGSQVEKSHFCAGRGAEGLCVGDQDGPLLVKKARPRPMFKSQF
jgi:secreted trypsin-like serine protease